MASNTTKLNLVEYDYMGADASITGRTILENINGMDNSNSAFKKIDTAINDMDSAINGMRGRIAALEENVDSGGGGSSVPSIGTEANLPVFTGENGVLETKTSSDALQALGIGNVDNMFIAIGFETSYEEVYDAIQSGKGVLCAYNGFVAIASSTGTLKDGDPYIMFVQPRISQHTYEKAHIIKTMSFQNICVGKNSGWFSLEENTETFASDINLNGIVKFDPTVGYFQSAQSGTDYQAPLTAGIDYASPVIKKAELSGTVQDNTEYRLGTLSSAALTIDIPTNSEYECWIRFTMPSSGTPSVSFTGGAHSWLAKTPEWALDKTYEISIKDGVIVAAEVGDGT